MISRGIGEVEVRLYTCVLVGQESLSLLPCPLFWIEVAIKRANSNLLPDNANFNAQ